MTLEWHIGDTRTVLATLEPGSVDLVLTSPPFLALRAYLPADHRDKADEIGTEATPGEFVDTLLDVVEACARVLAPHGSIAFELGDTYAGSGGGGDYLPGGLRDGRAAFAGSASSARESNAAHWRQKNGWKMDPAGPGGMGKHLRPAGLKGDGWPLDKSLTLIPELFRMALAYGVNPLTGRETDRWRVRNVVRWVRSNPPVGYLADKLRPATSDLLIACKAKDRWFDLDAVRTDPQEYSPRNGAHVRDGIPGRVPQVSNAADGNGHRIMANANGAPPLDWWKISPSGYPGAHYATFPLELCRIPILSMCPSRVCVVCCEPSRRRTTLDGSKDGTIRMGLPPEQGWEYERTTLGWSDCGHGQWRSGVVLDPFAGSGTALEAALGHGRSAVGIDLDERNLDLARDRLGMFAAGMAVHDHRIPAP